MSPPIAGSTIAGLTLGSTGLAITFFNTALAAYAALSSASSLAKDASILQAQLTIQAQLLRRWGQALGLTSQDAASLDPRLSSETGLFRTVVVTLSSIKLLLLDVDGLKKEYGLEATDEVTSGSQLLIELKTDTAPLLDGETLLREHDTRQTDIARTQKRLGILQKLSWILRDKEKFESLTTKLGSLIDALYSLLPLSDAEVVAKAVAGELLRTRDFANLLAMETAARNMAQADIAGLCMLRHRALRITTRMHDVPDMELSPRRFSLSAHVSQSLSSRSFGKLEGETVMVEWKVLPSDVSVDDKTLLQQSTNSLAYYLSRGPHHYDLSMLSCLGYFDNGDHRFGLVYSLPASIKTKEPSFVTLADILPTTDRDCRYDLEFDLGDKFRLAFTLAKRVYELHVSDWLHKAIRSHSVIFFKHKTPRFVGMDMEDGTKISPASPALVGYGFARSDGFWDRSWQTGSLENDPYTHPSYRNESEKVKYRQTFDLYSLGVLLLEIGLWHKVDLSDPDTRKPEALRQLLIDACDEQLGPAMGVIYRDAVRACLVGDFPAYDVLADDIREPVIKQMSPEELKAFEDEYDQAKANVTEAFYQKVVRELGKLRA